MSPMEEASHLRRKLLEAHVDIGRLLCVCKQAYNAQLSPRSSLSISLLEEIRRHEPQWQPEPRAEREPWPTRRTTLPVSIQPLNEGNRK